MQVPTTTPGGATGSKFMCVEYEEGTFQKVDIPNRTQQQGAKTCTVLMNIVSMQHVMLEPAMLGIQAMSCNGRPATRQTKRPRAQVVDQTPQTTDTAQQESNPVIQQQHDAPTNVAPHGEEEEDRRQEEASDGHVMKKRVVTPQTQSPEEEEVSGMPARESVSIPIVSSYPRVNYTITRRAELPESICNAMTQEGCHGMRTSHQIETIHEYVNALGRPINRNPIVNTLSAEHACNAALLFTNPILCNSLLPRNMGYGFEKYMFIDPTSGITDHDLYFFPLLEMNRPKTTTSSTPLPTQTYTSIVTTYKRQAASPGILIADRFFCILCNRYIDETCDPQLLACSTVELKTNMPTLVKGILRHCEDPAHVFRRKVVIDIFTQASADGRMQYRDAPDYGTLTKYHFKYKTMEESMLNPAHFDPVIFQQYTLERVDYSQQEEQQRGMLKVLEKQRFEEKRQREEEEGVEFEYEE